MNRHKQILAILLVILCLSFVYAWFRMPRQQSVVSTLTNPSHRETLPAAPSKSRTASSPDDDKALLVPNVESNKVTLKRNLFEPLPGLEPKKITTQVVAVKTPPPPPPAPPPPPPTRQELARNELNRYKSLGLLKKRGKIVAFLSLEGQIKLIRLGDSLINGYKVTDINDYMLTVRADDGDVITLRLR